MISDDDAAIASRVTWFYFVIFAVLIVSVPFAVAWAVMAIHLVD